MMVKAKTLVLILTLLVGCERSERMVESNVEANSVPASKTEAAQKPSHSEHGSTNIRVPVPVRNASATLLVANHPELKEITPLLSLAIDSERVQSFVKKYHLRKGHKFDSGSFTSEDQAYTMIFRENRIVYVVLHASPWPEGYGDPNWSVYSRPLPSNLRPTDGRKDVVAKLGKPIETNGNRWVNNSMLLWLHFTDEDTAIDEVWVSAAQ